MSPRAVTAPAFIRAARVDPCGQMSAARSRTAAVVPSGSLAAATITSIGEAHGRPSRWSSVRLKAAASLRAGMMIESTGAVLVLCARRRQTLECSAGCSSDRRV
jgi:hypothetical protein